jgi:hypothetical protein
VKYSVSILAIVILLGIITSAVIFRYEYMGSRLGFEIRADRWTGCIETWNNKENTYKSLDKKCQ